MQMRLLLIKVSRFLLKCKLIFHKYGFKKGSYDVDSESIARKFFKKIYKKCMCISACCVCLHRMCAPSRRRPEEFDRLAIRSPGNGVRMVVRCHVGAGN